jgi:hypothetical protein
MINRQFESLGNRKQRVEEDLVQSLCVMPCKRQTFLYSPALGDKIQTNKHKSNGERTNAKQERLRFR